MINVGTNPSGSFETTSSTTTSTTTTTISSVGGGIGGIPSNVTISQKHTWTNMKPHIKNILKITKKEIGLRQINIEIKSQANNVRITITKLEGKPANVIHEIRGKVYKYMEINIENLANENISNATIEFEVNKSWIRENNIDKNTISLNRYRNGWEKLRTRLITENESYIIYEAETPGFSVFAISGEEITTTLPLPETVPTTITTTILTTMPSRATTSVTIPTTIPPEKPMDYTYIFISITMVAIFIVVILLFFNKKLFARKK
jgi:PGF-pre-PGF domain-containing protein